MLGPRFGRVNQRSHTITLRRSKGVASGAKAFLLAELDGGAEAPPFRYAIQKKTRRDYSARDTWCVAWRYGCEFAFAQIIIDAAPADGVAGEAG
jgi:hypothetical protein